MTDAVISFPKFNKIYIHISPSSQSEKNQMLPNECKNLSKEAELV